ncbi:MAG: TolC family protein [Candidatus Omnitrophica bacterium]|jgi:outer membrane protein TolC|nr:TolC family protein [Candidatus Omnitrophota bacterium]
MNNKLICVFLLFLFIPCFLRAAEVSLDIQEAVGLALRQNRDIALQSQQVMKAKAKIKEAQAGLLPALSVSQTFMLVRGAYGKDFSNLTGQATIKQKIYTGGLVTNTIKYNGIDFQIQEALLDKANMDTAWAVKKAFYALVLSAKLKTLNQKILENTQKHLDYLQARYQNGQASESEIIKLESSLSGVKKEYEVSLNQEEQARHILTNLLVISSDVIIKPQGDFVYNPRQAAFDEALLEAVKNRPEVRQYRLGEKAAQVNVDLNRAGNKPTVYASWDYYNSSHAAAGTSKNWQDSNILGITFSWPIFDGGLTKAKIEEALVDLKKAQILKDKIISDIGLELKEAYLNLKSSLWRVEAADQDARAYKDNLSVVNAKYKQGLASTLDEDDALLKYEIANFNYEQAVYGYLTAREDFNKATGSSEI